MSLFAFAVFGIALVLPGATQPAVAAALGLGSRPVGPARFGVVAGLGSASSLPDPRSDRLPRRPLFVCAAAIAALALAVLPPLGGYGVLLSALALLGAGCGVFETVLNTAIPERDPARAASRLAVAHAAATLGAALGAGALAAGTAAWGWTATWRALAVALVAVGLVGALTGLERPARSATTAEAPAAGSAGVSRAIIPLALASAAYVGIETALTVFLPALGGEGAAISALWFGLFASRLAFAAAARRPGMSGPEIERRVLLGCAGTGTAVLAVAPLAVGAPALWAGAVGVLLGPVFPLLVTAAGRRFVDARGAATGIVVGAGSVGGVILPWAVGVAGGVFGLGLAMSGLAVAAAAMALSARRENAAR